MNRYFTLAVVSVLLSLILGCDASAVSKKSLPHTDFAFRLDEGFLVSHDYYVTNNSPHDLQEVHITITATGVDGKPKPLKQYWTSWSKGEEKKASASISDKQTADNVQKIEVSGYSSEYSFAFVLKYKK